MAQRRPSLADLVDLEHEDEAVDDLLGMSEQQFEDAVILYLRGDRRGHEVMRHPDVVERLHEALDRIRHEHRARYRNPQTPSEERQRISGILQDVEVERRIVRPLAMHERQLRLADEASEANARRLKRDESRLARAVELRRQLDQAQASSPRARATKRLVKLHEREFLALLREERAKDRDASAVDGAAGDDPPAAPSTARQVAVAQAAVA